MGTRIVFNGKAYTDPSEMPADVRALYDRARAMLVDADRNGIPDLLEGAGLGNVISVQETRLIVNGKEYSGVADMPADVRRLYEAAMAQAGGSDLPGGHPMLGIGPVPGRRVAREGFNWSGALLFALLAALAAGLAFLVL